MSRSPHTRRLALAAALGLVLLVPSLSQPAPAHADQNVGLWAFTCRTYQVGTMETITAGADMSGPLGDTSLFARAVCGVLESAPATLYNAGYAPYPLAAPRPGVILCSYVYRYGGYFERLLPPYLNSRGAAIVTVRDTLDDVAYTYAGISASGDPTTATYGGADCAALGEQFDAYNLRAGYNTTDAPLATVDYCTACGGGGGSGPTSGVSVSLPKPPHARHPARKPRRHCTSCSKP